MSATPEQIADAEERAKALLPAIMTLMEYGIPADVQELLVRGSPHLGVRAGALQAAITSAQAERVRVLEAKLEKIAGEAPAKEPSDGPTVAWPPNWSDDLQDVVNDMIIDAFADGYARALWEVGQTADAALTATGAPQ